MYNCSTPPTNGEGPRSSTPDTIKKFCVERPQSNTNRHLSPTFSGRIYVGIAIRQDEHRHPPRLAELAIFSTHDVERKHSPWQEIEADRRCCCCKHLDVLCVLNLVAGVYSKALKNRCTTYHRLADTLGARRRPAAHLRLLKKRLPELSQGSSPCGPVGIAQAVHVPL